MRMRDCLFQRCGVGSATLDEYGLPTKNVKHITTCYMLVRRFKRE